MIKKLAENHKKIIQYSRIYFVISIVIFMIFGTEELERIAERVVLTIAVVIGYLMFFSITTMNSRLIKSKNKYNWEKTKKNINFQMNFFLIFFGVFGTLMIIFAGISNPNEIPFILLTYNVILGIITGILKTKSIHIYENKPKSD
ncbi:MAG: hypothetical protein FH753_17480 [Firmicutes bacterium]|nr:hypothetical protein [Bacillota bacterium]